MSIHTANREELDRFALAFVSNLKAHTERASVVTLSGELGAGKTSFAQGVAKALGIEESVTSPTFVIEKIYQLKDQKFERLIHIDAYRLEKPHELEVLGWREIAADPANLILLEWPERVPQLIPEDAIRIRFDIAGEGRSISINGQESGS